MKIKVRRLIATVLTVAVLNSTVCTSSVYAETETATAVPKFITSQIDSKISIIPAYNIDGYNYVKLRDIASELKYTQCRFTIGYDSVNKAIVLNTDVTPDEIEEVFYDPYVYYTREEAKLFEGKLIVDGVTYSPTAYTIEGNNYFKLADLSEILVYELGYDNTSKTITIDTKVARYEPIEFSSEEASKVKEMTAYIKDNFMIESTLSGDDIYEVMPNTETNTPGIIKDEVLNDGLRMINYARYLAGLPYDVELTDELNESAQYGALLLATNDEYLSHYPGNNKNIPDDIYQKGYKATSTSNLYKTFDVGYGALYKANAAYMDDSDSSNIDRVGHRRWILNPNMKYTGLGFADGYSATLAFDKSRTPAINPDYVAWPQGLFPADIDYSIFNVNSAWSFTIGRKSNNPKYYIENVDDIKVTLTRVNDNKVWVFDSNSNSTGESYFNVDLGGYGYGDTIIFRPDIVKYRSGDVFTVKIENLKPSTVEYTVKFFSLEE